MALEVLFDVGNLGLGFGTELTRTGIFRASVGLARAALADPRLAPWFAALESFVAELQLARFEASADGFLGDRLLSGWTLEGDSRAASLELVERVLAADAASAEGRRLAAELKLRNRGARPRLLPRCFDVYHSLRSPLVPRERITARARAVTVYDMIPLLVPELSQERFAAQHRALLAAIDRERDWVVCNSECTKRDFCELTGVSPERVFVTPLAAATEIFHPERDPARIAAVRERYGLGSRPYLLSLCTLEPRKNLPLLMRAFLGLVEAQRWPDLLLVLVGPLGWSPEALFACLDARAGARDRILLPGYVPDRDLAALYTGARLFAFPSLYEGFGLPVLEAMQCGVPVLTSRTSALPEVVGSDARSVDPSDEDAVAQALLELLADPEAAAELGRRGLERSRRFSWARTLEETIRAYQVMLAGSP